MRLVYSNNGMNRSRGRVGKSVEIGDEVRLSDGEYTIEYVTPPHKPESTGRVGVGRPNTSTAEYFPSVVGAEWIEREDRVEPGMRFSAPEHTDCIWTVVSYHRNGDWVCREPRHGTTCNFPASIIAQRLVNENPQ